MTRHQVAVCTALACGPTASAWVPSKNQRLKGSLDVVTNVAVYNDCYPLVIEPARSTGLTFPKKEGIHASQNREGSCRCPRARHHDGIGRTASSRPGCCGTATARPPPAGRDLRADAPDRR